LVVVLVVEKSLMDQGLEALAEVVEEIAQVQVPLELLAKDFLVGQEDRQIIQVEAAAAAVGQAKQLPQELVEMEFSLL
jgi:lipoate synthase